MIVAGVRDFAGHLRQGHGTARLVERDGEFLLRLADAVLWMVAAEGHEMRHVHPRAGRHQRGEAAG